MKKQWGTTNDTDHHWSQSLVMPLHPTIWNNSAQNPRQIFVKTYIGIFNKICQENSSVVKTGWK